MDVFPCGDGGGEEKLQVTTTEVFSEDDASSKQTSLCYVLYVVTLGAVEVSLLHDFQVIVKSDLDLNVLDRHVC